MTQPALPPDAGSTEPSPPRTPQTATEGIKLIGGLVVVCVGLGVVLVLALVSMKLIHGDSERVAIATSAFSVIGTLVGAYFGLKIGSDGTQTAVAGMRDEASKAQAFAAHLPSENATAALDDARRLSGHPR